MLVIEAIKRACCAEFEVRKAELESPKRRRQIVVARMIGMAVARRLTSRSTTQIGRRFGGRDHSTVLYAAWRMAPYVKAAARVLPANASPEAWVRAVAWELPE